MSGMRKLPNVSSPRGAPIGRSNTVTEPDFPVKFRLERMQLVDGDYDNGGAYWGGYPSGPMWVAWGMAEDEEQEVFIRAKNREEAKEFVKETFINARFWR